jgi:hypothetical protein
MVEQKDTLSPMAQQIETNERIRTMTKELILPNDTEVPQLKLMPGDKEGNWLWNMGINTVFLCRPKGVKDKDQYNRVVELIEHNEMELHVEDRRPRSGSVRLLSNLNQEHRTWVDSALFSTRFDLVEVLYYEEPSD